MLTALTDDRLHEYSLCSQSFTVLGPSKLLPFSGDIVQKVFESKVSVRSSPLSLGNTDEKRAHAPKAM
jgi:hypothetical protein